jgi:hypothetical protein
VVSPVSLLRLVTWTRLAAHGSARFAYGLAFAIAAVWFIAGSIYVGKITLFDEVAP